jgi:hypothetical protein
MIRGDIAENRIVKPVGKCIFCGVPESLPISIASPNP